jgi:hypothetical protein
MIREVLKLLQGIQERDELALLFLGQIHREALVVKIHRLQQGRGGAIVKVRCSCRQAAQYRTLDAIHIAAKSCDHALAQVGRVERNRLSGAERRSAALDFEYRQIRLIEFRDCLLDIRVGLKSRTRSVSGADIQWQRQRMIADVGRIVAAGAGALE